LKGAQRALWGAFTERHAVFAIAASRHEDHARELLAESKAIVTSDRWWARSTPPDYSSRNLPSQHCVTFVLHMSGTQD
jgi:hypothetical protein